MMGTYPESLFALGTHSALRALLHSNVIPNSQHGERKLRECPATIVTAVIVHFTGCPLAARAVSCRKSTMTTPARTSLSPPLSQQSPIGGVASCFPHPSPGPLGVTALGKHRQRPTQRLQGGRERAQGWRPADTGLMQDLNFRSLSAWPRGVGWRGCSCMSHS